MVSILNWMMTLVVVTFVSACANTAEPGSSAGTDDPGLIEGPTSDGDESAAGHQGPHDERDPFAAQPDTAESLTNVSFHLEDVLENGALKDACAVWERDPTNRRKKLLCGKSMFFYEGFDGIGVPQTVFDFFPNKMPEIVGEAYSAYGLVPDPFSEEGRPLGFPAGREFGGQPTLTYGCASCHFGQMPDGRYAVGYPNLQYNYGQHALALFIPAQKANPMFNEDDYEPAALEKVRPLLDRLDGDLWLRTQLSTSMLPLLGAMGDAPQLTKEQQSQFASWPAGVLDAIMMPAPVDDEVHAPARILDLWAIPSHDEVEAFDMESPLLGWNGDAPDLHTFLKVFVQITGTSTEEWPAERFDPLVEYLLSLRAPKDLEHDAGHPDTEAGKALFASAGCLECHNGPRGQSRDIYTYDEIGTDDAYMYLGDPNLTGEACCGLNDTDSPLRHGLKAPRLTGVWAKDTLLHNGSVHGLEDLLCLNGPRVPVTTPALANHGHEYGCEELSRDEKAQLIHYLKTL